jgi:hypothetical protein
MRSFAEKDEAGLGRASTLSVPLPTPKVVKSSEGEGEVCGSALKAAACCCGREGPRRATAACGSLKDAF